jgi:hypothetical protein
LVGFALSFGANLPGYEFVHDNVPLLQGVRAAARWGFLLLIALATLSGFAVAWLESSWRGRAWWPAAAVALIGLVTIEALRAPSFTRHDGIPKVYARLADSNITAIVVLPIHGGSRFNRNAPYLLHQTRHWRPMVNGYSGWAPERFNQHATSQESFPGEAALADLRSIGVSHAVLHRAALEAGSGRGSIDDLRQHPSLELEFEEDGIVVYRIR